MQIVRKRLPLLSILLLLLAGCGGACLRVKESRERLFAGPERGAPGPHVQVSTPYSLLDKELTARWRKAGPLKVDLPLPDALAGILPTPRIVPVSVTFRPAAEGRLGVRVRFGLALGKGEPLFDFTLDADVRVATDAKRRVVSLSVSGEELKSARVHLPKDAGAALVASAWPLLPKLVRGGLSKKAVSAQMQKALAGWTEKEFPLAAAPLVDRVGELVRVEWSLGKLPVTDLTVFSNTGGAGVVVQAALDLPVTAGLGDAPDPRAWEGVIQVRISGAALAALANRAFAEGALPARYDANGKPDPGGPFLAGLAYGDWPRPVKVHLFREEEQCMALVLAGRPTLRVKGGKVHLTLRDAVVEAVDGDLLVQAAVWLKSLWTDAVEFSFARSALSTVNLGGEKVTFRLTKGEIGGAEFRFGLRLE